MPFSNFAIGSDEAVWQLDDFILHFALGPRLTHTNLALPSPPLDVQYSTFCDFLRAATF